MKTKEIRNESKKWAAIGFLIGLTYFLVIAGYKCLNPFEYKFILNGGSDSAISLFGWLFYEKAPIKQSLFGSFDSTYPHELSIVFSDAIIPLAVISKIVFGGVISNGQITQFIGIWSALCYALQGLFSGLVVNRLLSNKVMRCCGIILFVSQPILLHRLFYHNTLIAQWLILLFICLFLYRKELGNKRWIVGTLAIVFGAAVHLYYFPMLLILLGVEAIYNFVEDRKILYPIISIISSVFLVFIEMWMFGAFSCDLAAADPDWSYQTLYEASCNLMTFFNPSPYIDSKIMPPLPYLYRENGGFAYIGFGCIISLAFALLFLFIYVVRILLTRNMVEINRNKIRFYIFVLIVFLAVFFFAVGPYITYKDKLLFTIHVPGFLKFFYATFRAIGRFVWIDVYMMIALILDLFESTYKTTRKNKFICLLLIISTVLQLYDLSGALIEKHSKIEENMDWDYKIKNEKWEELSRKYELIYAIFDSGYPEPNDINNSVILFAHTHNMKLTAMYIAHPSQLMQEDRDRYLNDIVNGRAKKNVLYWFESEETMNIAKDYIHCEQLDNIWVGWVQ